MQLFTVILVNTLGIINNNIIFAVFIHLDNFINIQFVNFPYNFWCKNVLM